jgi:hypothetical protein
MIDVNFLNWHSNCSQCWHSCLNAAMLYHKETTLLDMNSIMRGSQQPIAETNPSATIRMNESLNDSNLNVVTISKVMLLCTIFSTSVHYEEKTTIFLVCDISCMTHRKNTWHLYLHQTSDGWLAFKHVWSIVNWKLFSLTQHLDLDYVLD